MNYLLVPQLSQISSFSLFFSPHLEQVHLWVCCGINAIMTRAMSPKNRPAKAHAILFRPLLTAMAAVISAHKTL